jgi:hypothetical protein
MSFALASAMINLIGTATRHLPMSDCILQVDLEEPSKKRKLDDSGGKHAHHTPGKQSVRKAAYVLIIWSFAFVYWPVATHRPCKHAGKWGSRGSCRADARQK